MDLFNGCSLIQLKNPNKLLKKKNRLLSKGMSNIYLELLLRKSDALKTSIF